MANKYMKEHLTQSLEKCKLKPSCSIRMVARCYMILLIWSHLQKERIAVTRSWGRGNQELLLNRYISAI
jgi:hypothetical protein